MPRQIVGHRLEEVFGLRLAGRCAGCGMPETIVRASATDETVPEVIAMAFRIIVIIEVCLPLGLHVRQISTISPGSQTSVV